MADFENQGTSRTAAKKRALALQELGAALLRCSPRDLQRLDLPKDLLEAIDQARRIRSREALRRQMQFIGSLMRRIDEESLASVQDTLRVREEDRHAVAQRCRTIELLRDRLIEGDPDAIQDALDLCPEADPELIRPLAAEAKREQALGKPPKAQRRLFRYLRDCLAGESRVDNHSGTRPDS
jgi:ribosome-associated protein